MRTSEIPATAGSLSGVRISRGCLSLPQIEVGKHIISELELTRRNALPCGRQQPTEMWILPKDTVRNLAAPFLRCSCTSRTRYGQFLNRGEIDYFHVWTIRLWVDTA